MKLKVTSFAQRDPRWGSIFLGTNTSNPYTIGLYGCLITCLTSYLVSLGQNETPATVNQKLKDNGGFQNGGLFVWTKSPVIGLTQTYLSPYYDGPVTTQGLQKIKSLLDQGYPLLCEVDFNPATTGEEMHFVLLCGYDGDAIFAMDPWQGQVVNLDVYGGPNRAILQFRAYDKILAKQDVETPPSDQALATCLAQHTQLVTDATKKDQLITELQNEIDGFKSQIKHYNDYETQLAITLKLDNSDEAKILGEITKLLGNEDQLTQLIKENQSLKQSVSESQTKITDLSVQVDSLSQVNKQQSETITEANKTVDALNKEIIDFKALSTSKFKKLLLNIYLKVR